MDTPVGNEVPDSDMAIDNIIMREIRKIEQWKDEGIDTVELERLLFEDIEKYQKEKIRILSERLESSGSESKNVEDYFDGSPIPPDKKDVITNFPTNDQITIENPPLHHRNSHSDDKTFRNGNGASKRITRNSRKRARSIGLIIGLFAIASALLLSGTIAYLIMRGGDNGTVDLDPFFTTSDLMAVSGSIIVLSSKMIDNGIDHSWTISPKDYILLEGDMTRPMIKLYFIRYGTYTIIHEVKEGDEAKTHTMDLTVEPLSLRIDREGIGDISRYDVNGNVLISNVRSLIDIPEASTFQNLEMDFWSDEGNPTVSTLSNADGTFKDGYAQTYSTIMRTNEHYLLLSGSIKKYDKSKIPFSGRMDTTDITDIDLYNRKASRMELDNFMTMNIQLQPGSSKKYSLKEDYTIFPGFSGGNYDLRLDDIAKDRYMSEDDTGNVLWGSSLLNWKAEGVLRYRDNVCINVSLWMEKNTLDSNNLESFSMNLYLSDGIPVALRTISYIKTKDTVKNPYTMRIDQRMIDFEKGTNPIIYGNIDDQHSSIINIIQIKPELFSDFHDNWTYVPIYGIKQASIPSEFDAEKAVSEFSSKQTFQNFVSGLKDPYSLNSNYSEMNGANIWKFSISESKNQWAWNQTVIMDNPVSTGFKSRIDPVGVDKQNILSIMTISGAESLFKELIAQIDPILTRSLYGIPQPGEQNNLDMGNWALSFISDQPYPGIGTMNQGTLMRIPFSMVISSRDGRFEAALDMETGQLSYLISRLKL